MNNTKTDEEDPLENIDDDTTDPAESKVCDSCQ